MHAFPLQAYCTWLSNRIEEREPHYHPQTLLEDLQGFSHAGLDGSAHNTQTHSKDGVMIKELITLCDNVVSSYHGQDLSHAELLKLYEDLAQAQQTVGDMLQMRTAAKYFIGDPHMPADGLISSVEASRRSFNI